ncbi:Fic family protein [Leifsonia sp. H3M29-4]|uniref:Fic family protein n=1 Tax=Salinibacterium metalliresistens TaxID=3031321 RepID=UPI0023DBB82F|nr:Fic family protein [Salinibacterium metalliresistens]MDF1477763.1 Fic family protein [Salinibacterium metalliresistens]
MFTEVEAAVPPLIAELNYTVPSELSRGAEEALLAAARMEAGAADSRGGMTRFTLAAEAIASSRIEYVQASAADFIRVHAGAKGNDSAKSMVAASHAIAELLESVDANGVIRLEALLAAHRTLMKDDRYERLHAGQVRTEQNWIGGSDFSPRGALHVPPVPERVDELLADLMAFANRDDVPVLAQAAIAHAQFETIHPFGDGNGRIGRALVGAILRRRGVMRNTIVPIASGLNARRDEYFAALTSYRRGHAAPLVSLVTRAVTAGCHEALVSIERMRPLSGAATHLAGELDELDTRIRRTMR